MNLNSNPRMLNRRLRNLAIGFCGILVFVVAENAKGDVVLGQIDSFTAASAADWTEGNSSPNPPSHNTGPGPDSLAGHLQNVADGAGSGGRMQMRNSDTRWQGNYVAAGVTHLTFFADNRSGNSTPFNLRIGLRGTGGSFVSSAVVVSDGSGWTPLSYDLSALAYVTGSGGSASLADTLSSVTQFEILSALTTPSFASAGNLLRGDNLVGDLRVDNITAVPEPTTSIALIAASLLGFTRRRR